MDTTVMDSPSFQKEYNRSNASLFTHISVAGIAYRITCPYASVMHHASDIYSLVSDHVTDINIGIRQTKVALRNSE